MVQRTKSADVPPSRQKLKKNMSDVSSGDHPDSKKVSYVYIEFVCPELEGLQTDTHTNTQTDR